MSRPARDHSMSSKRRAARLRLEDLEDRTNPVGFNYAFGLGNTGSDEALDVTTDAAGNIYVTGLFGGTVDFDPSAGVSPLTSSGTRDNYVAKYTAAGTLAWARRLEGEAPTGIVLDAQGNVYTAGTVFNSGDFDPGTGVHTLTSNGVWDAYVSKLDANGNFVWAKALGGSGEDYGLGLATDAAGNVFVSGSFRGTADFDPNAGSLPLTSNGGDDAFLAKLTSAGDIVWAKNWGSDGHDHSHNVATDADGSVVVTGYFDNTVDLDPGPGEISRTAAFTDAFISKFDADGNLTWAAALGQNGTTSHVIGYAIMTDGDGNVYTAGTFQGTADFNPGPGTTTLSNLGFENPFVTKMDPDGNLLWARSIRGSNLAHSGAYNLAQDLSGGIYITGYFEGTPDFDPGTGVQNITSAGSKDVFVTSWDSEGNYRWAGSLGGTGNDDGHGVAADPEGGVILAGFFSGTADLDPTTGTDNKNSQGSTDAFLSKFTENIVSGVVWDDLDADGIREAGEPFMDKAVVELRNNAGLPLDVQVTGPDGKYLFFDPPASSTYRVQFRPPPGRGISPANQGVDPARNSDAGADGRTPSFNLTDSPTAVRDAGFTGTAPAFGYAVQAGSTSDESGRAVFVDAEGYVYTTGFFAATIDFDPGPGVSSLVASGVNDAFVTKHTPGGALVWARQFAATSDSDGLSVAADADGNVYATGYFQGTTDFDPGTGIVNLTSAGNYDAFVTKLDADGRFIWARRWGGAGEDVSYGVSVADDGSVVTTGKFGATFNFDGALGTSTLTSAGSSDVFVVRLSSAGSLSWAVSHGGTGDDQARGLALDDAGNVLVTGYFNGTAAFGPGPGAGSLISGGGEDAFVTKLNGSGGVVWARAFGGAGSQQGWKVAADAQGNVHSVGDLSGTADFDPAPGGAVFNLSSAGGRDGYVSQLDAAGNFVRTGRLGGTEDDDIRGLALDEQGNAYVGGSFAGTADFDPEPDAHPMTSAGVTDAFVAKLDGSGRFVLSRRLGGPLRDGVTGLAADASGAIYTTGSFRGTADFDPSAAVSDLTSANATDIFLSKLVQAEINGVVWDDLDADGVREAGEPTRAGVVAELRDSNGNVLETQVTQADGAYSFIAPPDVTGGYRIQYRLPSGYSLTALDQGGDDTKDSDANPTSGGTDLFPLADNAQVTKDAGVTGSPLAFGYAIRAGSSGAESGRAVSVDADGNVYTTGFFAGIVDFDPGPGVYNLTASGVNDAFVTKHTSGGALVWAIPFAASSGADSDGLAVAADADGNVYATGYFTGTTDFDPGPGLAQRTTAGNYDIFVAKLDPNGNLLWVRTGGGTGEDISYTIAVEADGTVVLAGKFIGPFAFESTVGSFPLTSVAGSPDVFVAKLTSDGTGVWAVSHGGTGDDQARGVALDDSGNVLVTGYFNGMATFGPGPGATTLTSAGGDDAFVTKLNSAGGVLWAKPFGGTESQQGWRVAADAMGNVWSVGDLSGVADFDPSPGGESTLACAGGRDAYASKLDAAGNFVWAGRFGGAADDDARGLAPDEHGNAWIGGTFAGTADFDPGVDFHQVTSEGGNDAFVVKIDGSGNFVLSRTWGGTQADNATGLAFSGGAAYTTGSFRGTADFDPSDEFFELTSANTTDIYFAKFESSVGGRVWDDLDGDGLMEVGEPFVSGAITELFDTVDGIAHNGDDVLLASQFTAADGTYRFADPNPGGRRYVRIRPPAGTAGNNPAYRELTRPGEDSEVDIEGRSDVFQLADEPILTRNAGLRAIPAAAPVYAIGGAGADTGKSVVTDSAGNTYVVGSFRGTADFDHGPGVTARTSDGGADGFIAKYDPAGTLVWVSSIGDGNDSEVASIAIDADGNIYVTGTFSSTATFGGSSLASAGGSDGFVAKLNTEGLFQWARRLGGDGIDTGVGVAVDSLNNVYATGTFLGTATFDGSAFPVFNNSGGADVYVVRFNPDGTFSASPAPRQIGGSLPGDAVTVTGIVAGTGGITLAGTFTGEVDFDPTGGINPLTSPGGTTDNFIVRLTPAGTLAWSRAKQIGNSGNDTARGIALDAGGNVYVTGTFQNTVDFNPGAASVNLSSTGGTADAYVVKLNNAGGFEWADKMGGTGADSGTAITVDARGFVYVTGTFTGVGDFDPVAPEPGGPDHIFNLASAGGTDAFFTKLTQADGKFVFASQFGGTGTESPAAIAVRGEGDVHLIGTFDGTADLDSSLSQYLLTADGTDVFVSTLREFVIQGRVWRDANGNGVQDPGEPELTDATVELFDTIDGIVGNGNDVSRAVVTTTDGGYRFFEPADSFGYYVQVSLPEERTSGNSLPVYQVTPPGQGDDRSRDSDLNALNQTPVVRRATEAVVNLGAGFREAPLDAGGWGVGGTGADRGRAVTRDAAGNLYVAGSFEGTVDFDPRSGDFSLTSQGTADGFVAKYDPSGTFVWARRLGGTEGDEATAITTDASGNILVSGTFEGTANFGTGSPILKSRASTVVGQPSRDVFVLKLTGAGDFVWVRPLGGSNLETVTGIATDATGNVLTTGTFVGTADFDPDATKVLNLVSMLKNTANKPSSRDTFLSKLSPAGALVWARKVGSAADDDSAGVGTDEQGNIYFNGNNYDAADLDPGPPVRNSGGGFVAKYDGTGKYVWSTEGFDTVMTALTVSGGAVYTTGSEAWKLETDGTVVWETPVAGDQAAITVDDGKVYLTGQFTGTVDFNGGAGTSPLTAAGTDGFVTKLDASGQFLFARNIGGPQDDAAHGLAVAPDGTIFVVGAFQTAVDFLLGEDSLTVNSAGGADAFVWKLPPGVISGHVWHDDDDDGIHDPTEPDLGGAVVRLYRAVNGIDPLVGPGDDVLIDTRTSAADGSYQFPVPAPGTDYYIRVQPPVVPGIGFTDPDLGGNDGLDSDVNTSGVSPVFVVDGVTPVSVDAGTAGTFPPFGIAWTTPGPGESQTLASTVDAAGNIYVTGEFQGTVDFDVSDGVSNLTSTGLSKNAFVAKYTSGGILLWTRLLGGTDDIGGQGIAVDATGNVFVTGRFKGTTDFGLSSTTYDVFVSRLNPAGTVAWSRQTGGTGNDYGNAITVADGRVRVTGSFQGTADFDPSSATTTVVSQGTQDAFVLALTAGGGFEWVRQVGGGGGDDVGNGLTSDATGAVFVAGSFSGTADFDPGTVVRDQTSAGLRDAFVWKLDKDGAAVWASQAGGLDNDDANAVTVDSTGRVFVAGSFAETADFDSGPGLMEIPGNGSSDAFVWHLSAAGSPVWASGLGGSANEVGNGVAADGTGVYVAGTFQQTADFDPGSGLLPQTSAGGTDAFVAKLDLAGNRQWAHRLGGAGNDTGRSVSVDAAARVTFTGGLTGPGSYDPGDAEQLLTASAEGGLFIARVEQTLAGGIYPLDAYEPNNTRVTATDLGVVNVVQVAEGLSRSSSQDADWFRFELLSTADADDLVRIDFAGGFGDVDLELYRFGETDPITVIRTQTATSEEISLSGLPANVYHLRVFGAANPDYSLTVHAPRGFRPDAREPNNEAIQATELGVASSPLSFSGLSINKPGDADWFAFETVAVGTLSSEARIDFRDAQGDLALDLFDASGNPLRSSAGLDDSESVSLAGLPAGRYLVRVSGHLDAINPSYKLTVRPPRPLVADDFEIFPKNNTRPNATFLGEVSGEKTWENLSVHTGADEDWYQFIIPATGGAGHQATVEFVHAEGDLDLRLFEGTNPLPLAASTGNGDTEQVSLQGLTKDKTYYLRVSGFSGASQASYKLRITAPTATIQPDRLEGTAGNQTRQTASVVQTPGKTKLEGVQSLVDLTLTATDSDWFKFTTVGKGTVQHNVIMTYPAANGTLGLELYNSGGAKIATGVGANGSLVAPLKGLAAGTYYAKTFISKNGGNGSGYSLTFDAPGSSATVAPDDWTVMVYMTADSLTERAFNDINEMETAVAGLPGSVNLAVMWDQSASRTTYPTGNGTQKAWGTTGMALVSPDINPNQIATKFEILPEKNTGDPATLKAFVEWAKKNAPANKYAIVFWDHGDGLRGFNFDSQDGQPSGYLTTKDVNTGLAGQPKFDLIAFDACFMGVTETAYNLRDTASVVVASQDAIPGDGFEYDLALSALRTNPGTVTAEALATGLVQSFGARYGSTGRADTLSAVRTSALAELATALEAFSTAVQSQGVTDDHKRQMVALAAGSLLPSRSADTQRDLGSFLSSVATDGSLPPGIQAAAATALDKLSRSVISRTSDLRGHSGLSVYLPVVNLDLQTIDPIRFPDYATEYATFTAAASWSAMLTALREGTDERPTDGDIDDKGDADNGALASATDLQLLGSAGITKTALSLHTASDEDWYRFQVNESGSTLEADITVGGSGGLIFAELRSAGNVLLAQASGNRVRLENAAAGTYYLRFYANNEIDNYAFTINPPAAPGDRSGSNTTPDKAFELPSQLGETYAGYAVNAAVGGVAGQDWLRFSTTPLPQPDLRRVTLTVSGGQSLRAQLRSPTGYVVSSAEGTGTLVLPYTQSGAAETYTLVISNPNAAQVFYSLRLDSATATAAHPLDRFERANGDFTTDTQNDWIVTALPTALVPMRIEGGRVQITAATGQALRESDAPLGDTGVQAKFKLGSGTAKQVVTVLARANLTNNKLNAYEGRLEVFKGVATAIIYRTVNGLPSKLALGAGPKLAAGAEGVLRLEAQGQFLRLLVNGVPCVEFTDSFVMPPGLTGFAGTRDVLFDDFQASAIALPTPVGFSALSSGLGGEWQPLAGTFTAQQTSFVSGTATATALYNPARLADVLVSAGYPTLGANQSVAVIARHTGAAKGSYYEAKVAQKATGGVTATLTRFVNGAAKVLQTITSVNPSGTLGLEVRGNELRLILSGATQNAIIDKSVLLPGRAGLAATASMAVSNFTITALAPRFADNFNRANNDVLGLGWQEQPGGGNLRIAGNRLTADSGADVVAAAPLAARQDVSISARVDLSTLGQHTVGLIARYNVGAGSYYEARLTPGAGGTVTAAIHRVGGVSPKVLKSLKFTKATAGTLQFDVEGKTLKLSLFGESITVTDAEFAAAGLTGVHLGGGNSIDDFVVR